MSRPACQLFAVLILLAPALSPALPPAGLDARIIEASTLAHAGQRIEVHQHGIDVDEAFLHAAEGALARMEALLGRTLDVATLGPRIRIYVSPQTRVSHVWRGYHHPSDPQGILFVSPKIAKLAVAGRNATYAHELAHLLTWHFHSHSLREGLADFLALQLHPEAGIGPNAGGHDAAPAVPDDIARQLGTTLPTPQQVTDDATFRAAYYHGSYRLVAELIARKGMATFLQLYEAADPEPLYETLYGATREDLVRAALARS